MNGYRSKNSVKAKNEYSEYCWLILKIWMYTLEKMQTKNYEYIAILKMLENPLLRKKFVATGFNKGLQFR